MVMIESYLALPIKKVVKEIQLVEPDCMEFPCEVDDCEQNASVFLPGNDLWFCNKHAEEIANSILLITRPEE